MLINYVSKSKLYYIRIINLNKAADFIAEIIMHKGAIISVKVC